MHILQKLDLLRMMMRTIIDERVGYMGSKTRKRRIDKRQRRIKKVAKPIEILGVAMFGTQLDQVLSRIWLQRKTMLHIATVNPEYIMEARSNKNFGMALSRCLTVADGHGVVWASRILGNRDQESGTSRLERISGGELVAAILRHASQKGERVFLLGAGEGVAEKAAVAMSTKYPGLQIWSYAGAKVAQAELSEESSVTIAKINAVEPDYLLVAYGSPAQDLWIEENRPYLRVRVAMGIGGVLDEWAGVVRRCPAWIDHLGFKWAWRLLTQPWRLGRIMRVWHFGLLILYHKWID